MGPGKAVNHDFARSYLFGEDDVGIEHCYSQWERKSGQMDEDNGKECVSIQQRVVEEENNKRVVRLWGG